jgi:hypothetical protein
MYAVIAVLNSFSVRGRSRNTADFAAPHISTCRATFRTHCIIKHNGDASPKYYTLIHLNVRLLVLLPYLIARCTDLDYLKFLD